jgi:hypothetical protein
MKLGCLIGHHVWTGCVCESCGRTKRTDDPAHDWHGCVCRVCSKERHDWGSQEQLGPCPDSNCRGPENGELFEIAGCWVTFSCPTCHNTGQAVVGFIQVCRSCGLRKE